MIKAKLAAYIERYTPSKIKQIFENRVIQQYDDKLEYAQLSCAQEGEDIVLARFFGNKPTGFFVDVGAHHPKRFSNTFLFYKIGWRGINIDPNPDVITLFNKERALDINCNVGISNSADTLNYYMFNEPAINTFNKQLADEYCLTPNQHIVKVMDIKTEKLSTILDTYLPPNTQIDFMTIDAEGLDFEVLKSNNWKKYKPFIVLVEFLNFDLNSFINSELYNFMKALNYEFVAKTYNTIFFKKTL